MKNDLTIFFIPMILSLPWVISILLMDKLLPSKMPLFYSLPWGEGQLASTIQFLILPATLVCLTLINLLIFWHLHPNLWLLRKILLLAPLILNLILLISFMRIIFLFL